jgi:hypothetical protein
MKHVLSPLQVKILLEHYTNPEVSSRHNESNFHDDFIRPLVDWGALEDDPYASGADASQRITSLGLAWVQLILSTPPPREVYMDRHGNIIGEDE